MAAAYEPLARADVRSPRRNATSRKLGGTERAAARLMRTFALALICIASVHPLASAQCTTTPISVEDVDVEPGGRVALYTAPGGAGTNEDGVGFDLRVTVVEGEVASFTLEGDDIGVTLAGGAPPLRLRVEHVSTEDGSIVSACPTLTYWDLEAGRVRERLTIDNALIDSYTLTADTILEVEPVLPSSVRFTPPSDGPSCANGTAEPRCAVRVSHVRVGSFEFEVELIPNPGDARRAFFIDGDGDSAVLSADDIVCGDGVIEGAERCDDGNRDDFDECSNSCFINGRGACTDATDCVSRSCPDGFCESLCGNGTVDPGEPCDGGDDCTDRCRLALGADCSTGPTCESGLCSSATNTCAECVAATCPDGFTCSAERCVPTPGVDAGVADAGVDAGPAMDGGDDDSGVDAGTDAGTMDPPGLSGGGCATSNGSSPAWMFGLLFVVLRRRR